MMQRLLPFVMLVTGTTVAIMTQVFFNQGALSPSTHVLAWVKYITPLAVELALLPAQRGAARRAAPLKPESRTYLWIIGALDIFAYTLMSSSFAACGSSFASVIIAAANQICNAAAAVFVRKKKLSLQKLAGVMVVTVGLLIRMAPFFDGSGKGQAAPVMRLSAPEVLGVVAMVVSAAMYAALGVVYEWMLELEGKSVSHAEINRTISVVGATAMTGYQLLYTLPQWDKLVARPLQESPASPAMVVGALVVLGGCFMAHTNMTSKVIQHSGALAVSVINAFRSAVLMVIGHAMFCSAAKPLQCMSPVAVASAAVITAGVLCWSLPDTVLQQGVRPGQQRNVEGPKAHAE